MTQDRAELKRKVADLIREHVGIGYPLTDFAKEGFDPQKISIHAAGAAHMVVHFLLGNEQDVGKDNG
jgi:hypothetical protein